MRVSKRLRRRDKLKNPVNSERGGLVPRDVNKREAGKTMLSPAARRVVHAPMISARVDECNSSASVTK